SSESHSPFIHSACWHNNETGSTNIRSVVCLNCRRASCSRGCIQWSIIVHRLNKSARFRNKRYQSDRHYHRVLRTVFGFSRRRRLKRGAGLAEEQVQTTKTLIVQHRHIPISRTKPHGPRQRQDSVQSN